jgi:four helix bundle protein
MKDLKDRTREFALEIIKLYSSLDKTTEMQVIGKQFLRSGTSVGAHYREGMRARSDAEFISKLEGGLQELEETTYWFELLEHLVANDLNRKKAVETVIREANELIAIFISCVKSVKTRKNK